MVIIDRVTSQNLIFYYYFCYSMRSIYYILPAAFIIRLFHISYPVTGWHSWRQSDTASIARNFFESGHRILYPQINWGGNGTGFVESEFQLYTFMVSLLYEVFGAHDMIGRLLSVCFSVLTVLGIYLLVKKIMDEKTAVWSAVIYAIMPLNIFYGRAFMPDAFMLMCTVYAVYFFSEWLDKNEGKYFVLAWFFTTTAILLKLPTLYIGLPLLYLAYNKYGAKLFSKASLYFLTALVLIPVIFWYYHAHQLLLNGGSSFGIWTYGQDKWGTFALLADISWYNDIFFKSIAERHLTYAGFILVVWGMFLKRKFEKEKLFDVWLIAVLIFIFLAAQAHRAQEYYTLPVSIPASVFAGKLLACRLTGANLRSTLYRQRIAGYFVIVCLALVCVLSILRVSRFYNGESFESPVIIMGKEIQNVSAANDKIITVSGGNPVYLYHAHRFGWAPAVGQIDSGFISDRKKEGAKLIVGEKSVFLDNNSADKIDHLLQNFKVIKNEEKYLIISLY